MRVTVDKDLLDKVIAHLREHERHHFYETMLDKYSGHEIEEDYERCFDHKSCESTIPRDELVESDHAYADLLLLERSRSDAHPANAKAYAEGHS